MLYHPASVWEVLRSVIVFFTQYREERFRMTSESTNQRVLWWSITQTIILIITGIWQMRHLKSFFEAKKLVWSSDRITETITQVTFIAVMVFKHGNTLCFISIFLFKFNSVQLYLEQINWDTMSLNSLVILLNCVIGKCYAFKVMLITGAWKLLLTSRLYYW